jgi:hypothetical protein
VATVFSMVDASNRFLAGRSYNAALSQYDRVDCF